jgi:hypothetical protein
MAKLVPLKDNDAAVKRGATSRAAMPSINLVAHLLAIPKWPAQLEGPPDAASHLELEPRSVDFL